MRSPATKRRRAVPDPDPVYPFGDESPVPLPPFIIPGSGLETDGLSLIVKASPPLTVGLPGVGLNYGAGLRVEEGVLVSDAAITTHPPLRQEGEDLYLDTTSTFQLTSNSLDIKHGSSLITNASGLNLKAPNPPFYLSAGTLSMDIGPGFEIVDEQLIIKTHNGLDTTPENGLEIVTDDTLRVGAVLGLKPVIAPLTLTVNGNIQLDFTGAITQVGGRLTLFDPIPPVYVDSTGGIALKYGSSLKVEDGKLQTFQPDESLVVLPGIYSIPDVGTTDVQTSLLYRKITFPDHLVYEIKCAELNITTTTTLPLSYSMIETSDIVSFLREAGNEFRFVASSAYIDVFFPVHGTLKLIESEHSLPELQIEFKSATPKDTVSAFYMCIVKEVPIDPGPLPMEPGPITV